MTTATNSFLDFRSDTVTKPTDAMRHAMADTAVVDDVYETDNVVTELEQDAANLLGKEAALFVPTGTMANTIAIKLLTDQGQEVICDSRSHVFEMELSMMAWFSGVQARLISTNRGLLDWEHIITAIRSAEETREKQWQGAVVIENTHNFGGGTVYPLAQVEDICGNAHDRGIKVHMDGARLFNASAFLECDVKQIVSRVDTVMFCLSKGLGAPVGSILVGSSKQIERAKFHRLQLGGRIKGASVLAAAGLIALRTQPQNLHKDHENAKFLANQLSRLQGIEILPSSVQTNIVIFDIRKTKTNAYDFSKHLRVKGLLANAINEKEVRMVTHRDVTRPDCARAIDIVAEVLGNFATGRDL